MVLRGIAKEEYIEKLEQQDYNGAMGKLQNGGTKEFPTVGCVYGLRAAIFTLRVWSWLRLE